MIRNQPARVHVVTGASSGIGAAWSRRLAPTLTAADEIILIDRDRDALRESAGALGYANDYTVSTVAVDLTDPESITEIVGRIESRPLGTALLAAGISPGMGDWRRVFDVNLVATARLVEGLSPLVDEQSAAVCIASIAGHRVAGTDPQIESIAANPLAPEFFDRLVATGYDWAGDALASYAWSKRGVMLVVAAACGRWGDRGGRIVSISPGLIETPMHEFELARQPHMATMADITPLKRLGQVTDIAAVVEFLTSPKASFITGCDLLVDGGLLAGGAAALPAPD
jgi:NAD(P)-dependent dehydrogenase (short-subunit alcohol dehydrogenase family)